MVSFVIRFYWLFTLVLIVLITALSLWPVAQLPAVPGSDKTHHFIAYGALVFPCALHFISLKNWLRLSVFTLIFVVYSGVIELIQPYVNRYGEWLDLAANSLGLLCGITLAWLILRIFKPLTKTIT